VTKIYPGRYTASIDEPIVVFAIGMRINSIFRVHRWARPTLNTARLWRHVQSKRPDGYLGGRLDVYWRGVGMTQYWRDFDALEAFAHDDSDPHLAAWRQLGSLTRHDQTFGYWHETYRVEPGEFECIYGSMPRFGLAAAGNHLPVRAVTDAARSRLEADESDDGRSDVARSDVAQHDL
jgi:Monooxygenase af470-like